MGTSPSMSSVAVMRRKFTVTPRARGDCSVCCAHLYCRGRLYGVQAILAGGRWGVPYDWCMDERAEDVQKAIDAITQIKDPQVRARVATEVLDLIHNANSTLARLRREDIRALRAAGMSYRKIGEAIGIHFTRVKQIETGAPTGSARKRAAEMKASEGQQPS
jgi:hypothetical protein